ncbi:unnamed protein product [Owenia fusiformis]|uniref:Phospholipid scramblase n=1 Tax=Owenia fusiformis TaxID=6347 RepID=A0A8J1UXH9_OWEFU|nr:unnamed protein product [Owenia fusiformis]
MSTQHNGPPFSYNYGPPSGQAFTQGITRTSDELHDHTSSVVNGPNADPPPVQGYNQHPGLLPTRENDPRASSPLQKSHGPPSGPPPMQENGPRASPPLQKPPGPPLMQGNGPQAGLPLQPSYKPSHAQYFGPIQYQPGQLPNGIGFPGQQGMPITPRAPPQNIWMTRPESVPGCPPGLEYLTQLKQIVMKQDMIQDLKMTHNYDVNRSPYHIRNTAGQELYLAKENSCHEVRYSVTRFDIHITDNMGVDVINVKSSSRECDGSYFYQCCCCPGTPYEITVESPPEQLIGSIVQHKCWNNYMFSIKYNNHQIIFDINGPPKCMSACPVWNYETKITTPNGLHQIGAIFREIWETPKEYIMGVNTFRVSFPVDLVVKMKAIMISFVFLLQFIDFTTRPDIEQRVARRKWDTCRYMAGAAGAYD